MPGSPTSEHMMGITMNTTNANIQRLRSFVLALFLFMGRAHGVESAPYLVVDISGGVQADTFPLSELKTGLTFDLPTGAQWEYAGRAGTTNALNSGLELTDVDACLNLNALGRFIPNGNEDYTRDSGPEAGTAGVGSYAPNAWGLYDMHGNVWEWVLDWHPDGHRALGSIRSPQVDPRGTSHAPPGHPGRVRTARGGSWGNNASYCRSAMRSALRGSITNSRTGFRLVVNFNESSGKPVRDP
jgi:formylglycine-generating enzyme required for sulfatase activity